MKRRLENYHTATIVGDYIWGDEPENINELSDELEKRGVEIDKIHGEITAIIIKYSQGK